MPSLNPTRREYLALAGGAALFGATGVATANHTEPAKTAPLPDDSGDFDYATMGDADAPVVSILGNFKCPHTQDFVLGNLNDVVERYVEPGDLRIRFRSLVYEPYPDDPSHGTAKYFISSSDPRVARVALGVWDVDPDAYWRYNVSLFQDMVAGWVSYDDLRARLRSAGVDDRDRVVELAKSDRYDDELRATTDRFAELEVPWTPHLEIDGEILSGPQYDRNRLFDWLDARLAEAGGGGGGGDSDEEETSTADASVGFDVGSTTARQVHPDDLHNVRFGGPYEDTVAVAKPLSYNNRYPCHVRLHGVDEDEFDFALEEWEYQNDTHPEERFSYLVADGDLDELDGLAVDVGQVSANHEFTDVRFGRSFDETPVVFVQPQTYNGSDPIAVRTRNVSPDGMDVRVQEEQERTGGFWHVGETVGYVAIEPGYGSFGGRPFEAGYVDDGVDDSWNHFGFQRPYDDPAFVADVQSFEGWNPITIRYRNLDRRGVDVRLQEDRNGDDETWHVDERVGYFVAGSK